MGLLLQVSSVNWKHIRNNSKRKDNVNFEANSIDYYIWLFNYTDN